MDPEKLRDLYLGGYRVRYLIAENTIYVLRVWHKKEKEKEKNYDKRAFQ